MPADGSSEATPRVGAGPAAESSRAWRAVTSLNLARRLALVLVLLVAWAGMATAVRGRAILQAPSWAAAGIAMDSGPHAAGGGAVDSRDADWRTSADLRAITVAPDLDDLEDECDFSQGAPRPPQFVERLRMGASDLREAEEFRRSPDVARSGLPRGPPAFS